mgnify:CR=1 FL=1
MKKTLAIILTLVMIFGIVAFNTSAEETAAEPTVTIVTNKGSAVDEGTETYFTVRFDNFSEIKGIDVEITADKAITLSTVESSGFKSAAGENVNYTQSNNGDVHTIRFVDLLTQGNARIIFGASVDVDTITDPVINITGKYALDGKTFFKEDLPASGTFEIKRGIASTDVQGATEETPKTITPESNKFIPQGSVYKKISENEYVFADKNTNGEFIITEEGYQYDSFDIPENKITTFGASDGLTADTSLKFGSYSELNKAGTTHGTLVFEGEWLELKNYYIKNGYTVKQFVAALYKDVAAKLDANPSASFVYYKVNGKNINVYRFKQKNYMWKDDTNGILEYAIRLHGIKENTTYTGVAFSAAYDGTVVISENVKSVSK